MDIHRCRFVSYPPSAINALAFSHASSLTSTSSDFPSLRLAVGRANGDIEIWNPLDGAWHQESVICGGKDRSIEGLAWTQDPDEVNKHGVTVAGQLRLFSIGCSTAVTEWDLALGRARRHSSGNYGEVWCIAAQPQKSQNRNSSSVGQTARNSGSEPQEQCIVAGCADGAIVLLSTADGDLQFLKTLARPSKRKARVLSVTFQNRDIVLAGHADSTIRVFDTRNGRQINNMTLGPGPQGGPKEILVWSVKCLPNGWIVSGDSTGTVRFWDGKHYSLVQRIQGHVADILDVVTSADGETVISGGMDRRTTIYRRMGTGHTGQRRRWAKIIHRRLHKHDVKAMATFETQDFSILGSGGLDTNPIITPIREFEREHHRSLSNLPNLPPVCGAPKERLMMSWWGSEIRIWRFAHRLPEIDTMVDREKSDMLHAKRLVARMLMQGDEALTCADLTLDGSLLVACTISGVKVFRLRRKMDDGLKVSKLEAPQSMAGSGAKIVKFSADGKWLLLIRPNSDIQMYRIMKVEEIMNGLTFHPKPVHLRRLPRDYIKTRTQRGSLGLYRRSVSRVAFSADSRILIVGDLCGYIDSWVLQEVGGFGREGDAADDASNSSESSDEGIADQADQPGMNLGPRWIRNPAASLIPQLPAAPLILSFRPSRRQNPSKVPTGHIAENQTRRKPYRDSFREATGEDRLFVLTGDHQMYEFNVLSGKLSDWSRRNPTANLPSRFRKILERAKGSIWDTSRGRERIWVYGCSWLSMFDLSADFPVEVEAGNEALHNVGAAKENGVRGSKRKRRTDDMKEIHERGTHSTGAGGRIIDSELSIGLGRKFRRADGPELGHGHWISTREDQPPAMERGDDRTGHDSSMICLRRDTDRGARTDRQATGELKTVGDQRRENVDDTQLTRSHTQAGLPYWFTFKYRDILGIVPLDDEDEARKGRGGPTSVDDDLPGGVEVALIERPIWEVDLPPVYHGNQEWDH